MQYPLRFLTKIQSVTGTEMLLLVTVRLHLLCSPYNHLSDWYKSLFPLV